MRYALLADIHANLEALSAVLAAAPALGVDRLVGLGDIVGYYADPNACVDLLRRHAAVAVRGNHDSVAAGLRAPLEFSPTARRAIAWTAAELTPSSRHYLAALPLLRVVDDAFVIVHAALHPQPNESTRLCTPADARPTLEIIADHYPRQRICFFGHIHRRAAYLLRQGRVTEAGGHELFLEDDAVYLVNPGSIGQPRGGDPRPSLAIYDTLRRCVEFHYVAHDNARALRKAAAAGLIRPPNPIMRSARQVKHLLRRLRVPI